jgi:hypothetical protein
MKLENQVVSLEYAKKLKELGVKQESLYMWKYDEDYYLVATNSRYGIGNGIVASAYTVAELGEMLWKGKNMLIPVTIENEWVGFDFKKRSPLYLGKTKDLSEADARAKMLIYLLENKLITL